MKNKERYAKEIIEIACDGNGIAVDKRTGAVYSCNDISCTNCLFATNHNCCDRRAWAESEYIEKPVISKKDRAFLECVDKKFAYITRSSNNNLYLFVVEPRKNQAIWTSGYLNAILDSFNIDLPMVKWSDEEPWLIEDLKKLEVVEEYEK